MEKIVRIALATKFGNNVDEIIEVINNTPNSEHAVELLLGIYEEPIFKALHVYTYRYKGDSFKNLSACFNSYNAWTKTMLITVVRPMSKDIVILAENQDIVNKDNYTEYELSRDKYSKMDHDSWLRKTITLDEKEHVKEIVEDPAVIADWLETNLESEV